MDQHSENKAALERLREAQWNWDDAILRSVLDDLVAPETVFHLCYPFNDLTGPEAFYDNALGVLRAAWPDVERRDWIVIAGTDEHGDDWVGCAGHFIGTFCAPFLDIPPTGHLAHMRYHEFYRFKDGKITGYQAIWDIPEVMMQAGAWPLAPQLGRAMCVPGPGSGDGLIQPPRDEAQGAATQKIIMDMLDYLKKHPAQGGPEVMEMPRFWHETMNWYGPAGIGSMRGHAGFRNWHQIPFLNAMPDRGKRWEDVTYHFFAENNYCAVTGWPNMIQTISDGGWMGIAPAGKSVELRSLDFWRVENGRIRENWVLVDLLDLYRQIGVDVFARLREFNKARNMGAVAFPVGDP